MTEATTINIFQTQVMSPMEAEEATVPNLELDPTVSKKIKFSNTFTTEGGDYLVMFSFYSSRPALVVYRLLPFNGGTSYAFDRILYPDENIYDDFKSFRFVSGVLGLKSDTVSLLNTTLSGSVNAIMVDDIPRLSGLTGPLLSPFANSNKNSVENVKLSDGVILLATPSGDYMLKQPSPPWEQTNPVRDRTLSGRIERLQQPEVVETFVPPNDPAWQLGPISTLTQVVIWDAANSTSEFPNNILGRCRAKAEIGLGDTVDGFKAVYSLIGTYLANVGGVATSVDIVLGQDSITSGILNINNLIRFEASEEVEFEFETAVPLRSIRLEVNVESTTATVQMQSGELKITYLDIEGPEYSPTHIVAISGLNPNQVVGLSGCLNYELVPDSRLSKNLKTSVRIGNPDEMILAKWMFAKDPDCRGVYANYAYKDLIESGKSKKISSYDYQSRMHAADWGKFGNFLKGIGKVALNVVPGIVGAFNPAYGAIAGQIAGAAAPLFAADQSIGYATSQTSGYGRSRASDAKCFFKSAPFNASNGLRSVADAPAQAPPSTPIAFALDAYKEAVKTIKLCISTIPNAPDYASQRGQALDEFAKASLVAVAALAITDAVANRNLMLAMTWMKAAAATMTVPSTARATDRETMVAEIQRKLAAAQATGALAQIKSDIVTVNGSAALDGNVVVSKLSAEFVEMSTNVALGGNYKKLLTFAKANIDKAYWRNRFVLIDEATGLAKFCALIVSLLPVKSERVPVDYKMFAAQRDDIIVHIDKRLAEVDISCFDVDSIFARLAKDIGGDDVYITMAPLPEFKTLVLGHSWHAAALAAQYCQSDSPVYTGSILHAPGDVADKLAHCMALGVSLFILNAPPDIDVIAEAFAEVTSSVSVRDLAKPYDVKGGALMALFARSQQATATSVCMAASLLTVGRMAVRESIKAAQPVGAVGSNWQTSLTDAEKAKYAAEFEKFMSTVRSDGKTFAAVLAEIGGDSSNVKKKFMRQDLEGIEALRKQMSTFGLAAPKKKGKKASATPNAGVTAVAALRARMSAKKAAVKKPQNDDDDDDDSDLGEIG